MSALHPFNPRLIGQTEKAMSALLERELSGSGVSEPQWVTLVLAVSGGTPIDRRQFAAQVAGGLKVSEDGAAARIAELSGLGLLDACGPDCSELRVTDAGRELHDRVRRASGEITRRLWGDLPDGELAIAAKVLNAVLQRADAELASRAP